jgi:hypothetical protein
VKGATTLLAQETGYLLAGALTAVAAVVVTVLILVSSPTDEDETSR